MHLWNTTFPVSCVKNIIINLRFKPRHHYTALCEMESIAVLHITDDVEI
jgi:hypothetical protein